ncbi:MAG TPA: hypothetical protein VKZ79_12255 [Alphaproteobacteria bacterium]|jgi:hypothetical protein|nr:hypothetical protein [Alphaproteobacteria bacterium]
MNTILHKIGAAAILIAATAVVPACTQSADKATMDKMSKDVEDAKAAADAAARAAQQAADSAKAAEAAAEQASATHTRATGRGMRNK